MYTLVFKWYFKLLSGYMSKNMVIHGTFFVRGAKMGHRKKN